MSNPLIAAIRVKKLFGLYSYELPSTGAFSNAAILYGDNGVGKSTVLRLVFHLLSAHDNRGHRGALYSAAFERLEVDLASGATISASRGEDDPTSAVHLSISRGGKKLATWRYMPRAMRAKEQSEDYVIQVGADGKRSVVLRNKSPKPVDKDVPQGEKAYLTALAECAPTMFILNADRRLDSDAVSDPSDEMELRKMMHFEEATRINDLVTRSREIALTQALAAAARWISQKAVLGANQGSMNVHSVYINVLHHLVDPSPQEGAKPPDIEKLYQRLAAVQTRTAELALYELETPLSANEFLTMLQGTSSLPQATLAAGLLEPYIRSVEGRLEALEPLYKIVDQFVTLLNALLRDKTVAFKLSSGFAITNRLETALKSGNLSSGEQQLLLLFCYVLTARDRPTVFMIDEPEISLNVKWQRELVQALLNITDDSQIQFLFASHSLELLSQHRDRVVKLVDKV